MGDPNYPKNGWQSPSRGVQPTPFASQYGYGSNTNPWNNAGMGPFNDNGMSDLTYSNVQMQNDSAYNSDFTQSGFENEWGSGKENMGNSQVPQNRNLKNRLREKYNNGNRNSPLRNKPGFNSN